MVKKERNTDRKWSKMRSIKYRNHQYMDGTVYQETVYFKRYVDDTSCCSMMQHSGAYFFVHLTCVPLQDCISKTNRDALEKLHMSFVELEEKVHETNTDVETEVAIIEPELKSKYSRHKWLAWGAGAALAGVMAHLFKN